MPDYIKMDRQAVPHAEGVGCPEELEVVREIGIERAQGFLLGKPQPM